MSQATRMELRTLSRAGYQQQQVRVAHGNRVVAIERIRLGIKPSEKASSELTTDEVKMLDKLTDEFATITEGLTDQPTPAQLYKRAKNSALSYSQLALISLYNDIHAAEKKIFAQVKYVLQEFPIWNEWLQNVNGVGDMMGSVILGEFDIEKCDTVSKMWAYAGLDVGDDGAGRSRRREHRVLRVYKDRNGNEKTRKGLKFNPHLKTKLLGVLGSSFIKQVKYIQVDEARYNELPDDMRKKTEKNGVTTYYAVSWEGRYRKLYKQCKARLAAGEKYGEHRDKERIAQKSEEAKKKAEAAKKMGKKLLDEYGVDTEELNAKAFAYKPVAHRHAMANRYMIKMFLLDLWLVWRKLEGLPITQTWYEKNYGPHHQNAAEMNPVPEHGIGLSEEELERESVAAIADLREAQNALEDDIDKQRKQEAAIEKKIERQRRRKPAAK